MILSLTFYQHVVHIYLHVLSNLLDEHFVHKPLICYPRILQTERHDLVAKKLLASDEQYLFLVQLFQLDLV